jgi:hypothetical protein
MATSQNGWSAGDPSVLDKAFAVAGAAFPGGVRRGDVAAVLGYVAAQIHTRVEPLVSGWCWGYNYREVKGSNTSLSNHASGTAIDCNAPSHPLGVRGTFTTAQRAEIHNILAEAGNVVRWGGDYTGRVDEMHFEINAGAAAVKAVADRLKAPGPNNQTSAPPEDAMLAPAAVDDYVSVPCNGATALFISTAFTRTLRILGIAAVRDNDGSGNPAYTSVQPGLATVNPDQPGPIAIGPGCRVVQLRYSADHAFTVWCA